MGDPYKGASSSLKQWTVTPSSGRLNTNSYMEGFSAAASYLDYTSAMCVHHELCRTNSTRSKSRVNTPPGKMHCGGFMEKPVSCQTGGGGCQAQVSSWSLMYILGFRSRLSTDHRNIDPDLHSTHEKPEVMQGSRQIILLVRCSGGPGLGATVATRYSALIN